MESTIDKNRRNAPSNSMNNIESRKRCGLLDVCDGKLGCMEGEKTGDPL
jgi:hypothetical protein